MGQYIRADTMHFKKTNNVYVNAHMCINTHLYPKMLMELCLWGEENFHVFTSVLLDFSLRVMYSSTGFFLKKKSLFC